MRLKASMDGKEWILDLEEVTGDDVLEVRRATGMSLKSLLSAAYDDPDIDSFAAIVWLARRAGEPNLKLGDVLKGFSYFSEFELDMEKAGEAEPEDVNPEM